MTKFNKNKTPTILCILDGWGYRKDQENNAIALGKTPNWDRLIGDPSSKLAYLATSGEKVGLPDGQMGNSEVGHMNIGTGRVILQDLPKINKSIQDDTLKTNPILLDLIKTLKENKSECHIIGLLSKGGVHSHQDHLVAIIKIIASNNIKIRIHAFLDGRDTPPKSAIYELSEFLENLSVIQNIQISTISGRYFGMDRDKRWERTKKSFDAIMHCKGKKYINPTKRIEQCYLEGKTDEFIEPMVNEEYYGVMENDCLLSVNFRADRIRQILDALVNPQFKNFNTSNRTFFSKAVGLTNYSDHLSSLMSTMFPTKVPRNSLGEILSKQELNQLRISETEKYPHVTFFFNGGSETPFKNEKRILVPSPDVSTYDLKPEMSAYEVTELLTKEILRNEYDFIVVNYANGDMVGHTGVLSAAVKAVETIDNCLGLIEASVRETGGTMLITADHGNCELMVDPVTLEPFTSHTTGEVPLVIINYACDKKLINGSLADIAPTVLEIMGLKKPEEMTGKSLLK